MMKVDIQQDGYNSIKITVNGKKEYRLSVQAIGLGRTDEHVLSVNAHPGTLVVEPRAGNVVWVSQK